MPRTRMMGAGLAGSSAYRSRTHGDQGGGNKLQGLPPTTNKNVQYVLRNIQNKAYGESRNVVFCMNQIGGVGAVGAGNGSRTFNNTADGVKDCVPGKHYFKKFDGTCKPCSKCCYEICISAECLREEKTYELLSFHCSDDEELYLNVDVFYDSSNNKSPKQIQKCLKCCANLTKYGAQNSLIGDHGIYNLESCYDFGIRVYNNNTFNYELYWFSWCAKHTMKWIKLNPDNNDVIAAVGSCSSQYGPE